MGTIQDGLSYMAKRHEQKAVERAERKRQAEIRREEERKRREAERKERLAQLTERFRRRFGWDAEIMDYGHDDWGDSVYLLSTGEFITISERNPTVYRRKPYEDPFKDMNDRWREQHLREEIREEILRDIKAAKTTP